MTNSPPYTILRKIPNFQQQLSSCLPAANGLYQSISVAGHTSSGGYIFAIPAPNGWNIAVFDAGLILLSEATYNNINPVAFADLNGDGKTDIIGTGFLGDYQAAVTVSLGDGGAGFQPPVYYATGTPVPGRFVVADVNGDRKPDLVTADGLTGRISVLLGNGDGTFQTARVVVENTGADKPQALAVADLNGDGKLDLAFTTSGSGTTSVEVALGNGDGTFGASVAYAVADSAQIAIGDVNGDGKPDIVTSGITVLLGDGKGGFANRRDIYAQTGSGLS
jgi:hypothetical protein